MDESRRLTFLIFAGLFGLTLGSFLNVCIFRLPRNCMTILRWGGRLVSRCPSCGSEIAWYDNIPVLSWIVLGGKCRACASPISIRYAAVELLTGALIAWAAYVQLYRPDPALEPVQRVTLFVLQAYLISAIVVSTFIDLDFEILPDEINISGIAFGLIAGTMLPEILFGAPPPAAWLHWLPVDLRPHAYGLAQAATGALVGGGVIYAVGLFGTFLFRKRVKRLRMDKSMGLGDVKYLAFLGAFLGWQGIMLTFIVSICAGSVYGIGRALVSLRLGRAWSQARAALPSGYAWGPVSFLMGKVPFGPFLSVGALAAMFARPQLIAAINAYLELVRPRP